MAILPSLPGWFSGQTPGGESKTLGRADGGPAPPSPSCPGMPPFPAIAAGQCPDHLSLPIGLDLRQALERRLHLRRLACDQLGLSAVGAYGPGCNGA
jgi:hypothetical protein